MPSVPPDEPPGNGDQESAASLRHRTVQPLLRAGRSALVKALSTLWAAFVVVLAAWFASQVGVGQWLAENTFWPKAGQAQLRDEIAEVVRQGRVVKANRAAALRGIGDSVETRLIVVGPRPKNRLRESDELRIYEVGEDTLRLARTFRPTPVTNLRLPRDLRDQKQPLGLKIVSTTDLDEDGSDDVVLSLGEVYPLLGFELTHHPVVVRWNPAAQTYEFLPLLPPRRAAVGERFRPGGGTSPIFGDVIAAELATDQVDDGYRERLSLLNRVATIDDEASDTAFKSHAVEVFVVRRLDVGPLGNVLVVGAYVLGFKDDYWKVQVVRWLVTLHSAARPKPQLCSHPSQPLITRIPVGVRAEEWLAKRWRPRRHELSCPFM